MRREDYKAVFQFSHMCRMRRTIHYESNGITVISILAYVQNATCGLERLGALAVDFNSRICAECDCNILCI